MRDGLRLGALKPHVAGLVLEKVAVALEPALLARTEVLRRRTTAGEEAQRNEQVHVDPDEAVGILMAQLRGDDRAPVAALGRKLFVAEHGLHQLHPEIGGGSMNESRGCQRSAKRTTR